ncbi:MAG: tetratricopeptide repeat protein [Planctomycetota bacterium]|jgi:putative thioredoxin
MPDSSPWIVETSSQTFQQDAIERSRDVPVVVDFWAEWCQPCRLLGPVLEKLAEDYAGRFVLVKADTEKVPDVAAAFGVTSIPAVFGLRNGGVVDQFLGVLPEEEVRAWIERLLPSPAEDLAAEARAMEATDPQAAEAAYREAIKLMPSLTAAGVGLARMLLARDELGEARRMIEEMAAAGVLDAEGEHVQAELIIGLEAKQAGSVEACREAVDAAPDDPERQLLLAKSLAGAGAYEEAMQRCLGLIQQDRHGLGEKARELMVHVFHLLGPESELAGDYRRKLTMVLY